MDLDKLNKWLTLLANLGVVAGIFFLAVEIRQNQSMLEDSNRLSRFESRMSAVDTFNDWRGQWVQDEELTRIWVTGHSGEGLSAIEQARYDNLCTSNLWIHLKIHEWGIAMGDMETVRGHAKMIRSQLEGSPGHKRCWEVVRAAMLMYRADSFIEAVENDQF